jgi:hypothetical protein
MGKVPSWEAISYSAKKYLSLYGSESSMQITQELPISFSSEPGGSSAQSDTLLE